jgi:hypothetical protein
MMPYMLMNKNTNHQITIVQKQQKGRHYSDSDSDSDDSDYSKRKKHKKKNKRLYEKPLKLTRRLRKFRSAVYAVYFSLFFPKYTKIFTKKRYLELKKSFDT